LRRTQCDMEHRSVLGDVDLLAREHSVAPSLDACRRGELDQQLHRLRGHRAFRPVEEKAAERYREFREPLRILDKGPAHVRRCAFGLVLAKLGELSVECSSFHGLPRRLSGGDTATIEPDEVTCHRVEPAMSVQPGPELGLAAIRLCLAAWKESLAGPDATWNL